jgi:hypothetical protein
MNVKRMAAALVACLAVAGCGDDGDKYVGDRYSLTVFAYNAITGEPIPSADLASGLSLYQGATKMKPAVLDSTLPGAVVFSGIPADYNTGSSSDEGFNKVYPIVANITGYGLFQGEVSFKTGTSYGDAADDLFAQVGTIYLFPLGHQAPDYRFTVLYNGKPVPNAVVLFDPDFDQGAATDTDDGNHIITPVSGHARALQATTDANGQVTFAGAELALGVYYQPSMLPVAFEGAQLAALGADDLDPLQVGFDNSDQILSAYDLAPDEYNYGLYVTYASNKSEQVDPTGTLTIVFSRPVSLTANNGGFEQYSYGTDGVLAAAPTVELSTDGLTLTLRPNWATDPDTANTNPGAYVRYDDGTVTLNGSPAAGSFEVFGDLYTADYNGISRYVVLVKE